ncbi:MAG: hypothetical protein A3A44_00300 [Candidatus Sungbacteria bacterium RIFCSPLOWO2_01_FULL_60_25]|uniref:Zinc-finger domain-containing protein n=1 Tax=Candidatus Sungbacteria bacterium RIFCSPLOWO2_01_FULL_60_25 TaxID=1802281 RepID=A0A1G2LF35_9BACT|nr:MAG: hypothetical protein A3A44_00300 [Candidatus Sungbacteria bacterium RIFCSPLOWO2_01_FULL_60_25]
MTCDGFRREIRFAATTDSPPNVGITAHLDRCAVCREWLVAERKFSDRLDTFARRIEQARPSAEGLLARLMKRFGL